MENEIQRIRDLLQRTFEKNSWHGPAVKEVLADITDEQSKFRFPKSHSIAELVAHMTAWRVFIIKKIEGDREYTVKPEANFPSLDWKVAMKELEESQRDLLDALEGFDPARLNDVVPHGSYTYTYYRLFHGIIHHDLYHAGQIALMKKQTF
jgi:uncharacterized damage-inducible protein DinB